MRLSPPDILGELVQDGVGAIGVFVEDLAPTSHEGGSWKYGADQAAVFGYIAVFVANQVMMITLKNLICHLDIMTL
jgi:hypothetical protein